MAFFGVKTAILCRFLVIFGTFLDVFRTVIIFIIFITLFKHLFRLFKNIFFFLFIIHFTLHLTQWTWEWSIKIFWENKIRRQSWKGFIYTYLFVSKCFTLCLLCFHFRYPFYITSNSIFSILIFAHRHLLDFKIFYCWENSWVLYIVIWYWTYHTTG